MTKDNLTDLSIEEIGRGLRDGTHTCSEIVGAHLDLIDRTQPILNAFVLVDYESANHTARGLDEEIRRGRDRGPLHGVPVAVKDLIAVAELPMRAGSSEYRRRSKEDARVVADLRAAGAIILGLTRLHEIALGPTGLNPHDGGARNPHELGHIPGGSSSGSAVAVAAHLSPIALGTDTGGSVRIPAALCGAVGFKPTHGLLSNAGVMPLSPTLDSVGLLARSVRDIEIALNAVGTLQDQSVPPMSRWRVGVLANASRDLQPAVQVAYERCLQLLRDQGIQLVELGLEGSESVIGVSSTIMFYEAYRAHRARFRRDPKAFGSDIRERLSDGAAIGKAAYAAALRAADELRGNAEAWFDKVSFVVSPTVPVTALSIAEAAEGAKRAMLPRNTRLFNVLGTPAISLPAPAEGLPVGFQVAAPRNADASLLTAAKSIQQVFALDSQMRC